MKKYVIAIVGSSMLVGCTSSRVAVCPTYPTPNRQVLAEVFSLNSPVVDSWMHKQYKLRKKLKVCRDGK